MRRGVLWTSLIAAGLVLVHAVLWDAVRRRGGTFIADNAQLVTIGASKATLFRVSLLADALGSYLLTVPATVTLWRLLRRSVGEVVDVFALSGLVYAALGALAAAILAIGGETLIRDYATATGGQAKAIATTFAFGMDAATAVWQTVGGAAGAIWWLASGWLLRDRWRWFSRYSMALGAGTLLACGARMAGVSFDSAAPVTPVFMLIGVWVGWLGVRLNQDEDQSLMSAMIAESSAG